MDGFGNFHIAEQEIGLEDNALQVTKDLAMIHIWTGVIGERGTVIS